MNALEADSRLRRRRWLAALAATYLFRLGLGVVITLPIVTAVQASGIMQFPGGDHLLFEAGGAYLLEVLASQRAVLAASVAPTLGWLAVAAVLGIGPEFLLLRAASRGQGAQPLGAAARRSLGRLVWLGAAVMLSRVLLGGLSVALGLTARSWFTSARDARVPDLVLLGVLAVGAVAQLVVSTWRDLSAAAVVERGASPLDAILIATSKLDLRSFGAYGAALGATLVLILSGSLVASAIDVSQLDAWRALLVLVTHQAVVLGSIALRAVWLSRAVRAVEAAS